MSRIYLSLCSFVLLPVMANATDILAGLPGLPSGFTNPSSGGAALRSQTASEGGLDFSLTMNGFYDSNVTRTAGSALTPKESDFIVTTGLAGSYLAGNSRWKIGVNANISYREHFEREDFSDTNYGFSVYGGYQSGKTVASFTTGLVSGSGVNLQAAQFVNQVSYNTSAMIRYQLSGKTSLLGNFGYTVADNQSQGFADATNTNYGVSALWKASSRINLGPGIRYGVRTGGGRGGDLTVIGPTLRINYDLSSKVSLRSTIGIDFSDSPFSGNDTLWNWSVTLNYSPSKRWGLSLGLLQDTQATFVQGGGFDQIATYNLNYWRQISIARLSLGLSYQDRGSTDSLPTLVGVRDSQLLRITSSAAIPVFNNRASLSLTLAYQDFSAEGADRSWDGFQAGMGLGWRF